MWRNIPFCSVVGIYKLKKNDLKSQNDHKESFISVTFIFEIIVMDKCNFAFINYGYCLYFTNLFLNYVRP